MARMWIVPGLGAFETAFAKAAWVATDEAGRACPTGKVLDGGFEKIGRPESEEGGNDRQEQEQRRQVDEDK
jgi:hypothetical protein